MAKIMPDDEKIKEFFLKSGTKAICPLLPLLVNMSMKERERKKENAQDWKRKK